MPPPVQEVFYTAHPDVVSAAIKVLSAAVFTMGGTLVSVIVYIWRSHKKDWNEAVTGIESKIGKLAESLDSIADKLFSKTDVHEHRLTEIEGEVKGWRRVCDERHKKITQQLLDESDGT